MPARPGPSADDYEFDDDDGHDDDPEGPQSLDLPDSDEDDKTETVECPACRAEIAEFAERCPVCGEWIDSGRARRPSAWVLWTAVALLAAFLLWLARR